MRDTTSTTQRIFTNEPPTGYLQPAQVSAIHDVGAWLTKANQWPKHTQIHALARDKAWEVLQHPEVTLPNFTALAQSPIQLFLDRVPTHLHQPVADALHILGRHVYNNDRHPSPDQALHCLRLANRLTPKDLTIIERFSDIARCITEDDLRKVRPESRERRIKGFQLTAQHMLLGALESRFGVLEGALRNSSAPEAPQVLGKLPRADQEQALILMELLSNISLKLGLSGNHLHHLQLAEDVACTHLAFLGYARSPSVMVNDLFIELQKTSSQRQVDTIRSELRPGTENILEHLAHIQDVKLDKIPRLLSKANDEVERAILERKLALAYNISDGIHFVFGMLHPHNDIRRSS